MAKATKQQEVEACFLEQLLRNGMVTAEDAHHGMEGLQKTLKTIQSRHERIVKQLLRFVDHGEESPLRFTKVSYCLSYSMPTSYTGTLRCSLSKNKAGQQEKQQDKHQQQKS